MRLRRIAVHRYAQLRDVVFDLEAGAPLHVILGPNEAGKSQMMAAVADALFGFGHRTEADFALAPKERLLVGLEVEAPDGTRLAFDRRKGHAPTLFAPGGGAALPDAALEPFLGGLDKAAFLALHALNGERLRDGARALLRREGSGLLEAAGLGAAQKVLAGLQAEAAALFGDRRGSRKVHLRAADWDAARQERDAAMVRPTGWQAALVARDEAQARLLEAREAQAANAREASRLRRVAAARPLLEQLRQARDDLEGLADAPAIDTTTRAALQDAITTAEAEDIRARAAADRAAGYTDTLATLQEDAEAIAGAGALRGVLAERAAARDARAARPAAEAASREAAAQRTELARILGVAADAGALSRCVPPKPHRDHLRRLLDDKVGLDATRKAHAASVARARTTRDGLAAALARLAATPAPHALEAAIKEVRALGPLDKALAEATVQAERHARLLRQELAALPAWHGDAARLAALALPLPAEELRVGEALALAAAALATAEAALRIQRQALAAAEAEIEALAADSPVPTREAIAEARRERDAAWTTIRRRLEGDLAAQLAPGSFEDRLRAADALADGRADEAERVARHAAAVAARAAALHLAAEAGTQVEAAASAHAAASADWAAIWASSGLHAGAPPTMREWRAARERVRERLAAHEETKATHSTAEGALEGARARLLDALGRADAGETLAALLGKAEAQRAAEADAAAAHAGAARALTAAEEVLAQLLATPDGEATWRTDWEALLVSLELPAAAAPVEAEARLEAWMKVSAALTGWRQAASRLTELDKSLNDFATKCATLGLPPGEEAAALDALERRLDRAEELQRDRATLVKQIAEASQEERSAKAARSGALDRLRRLGDPSCGLDALRAILADADRRASLEDAEAKLREALAASGGGMDAAALRAEAEAAPHADDLAARLDMLTLEAGALGEAIGVRGGALAETERTLLALEGRQGAEACQQRMQDAAAGAATAAAAYARLHVARTLLATAITRFRQEEQAPLLVAAGKVLAALTEGRHTQLMAANVDGEAMLSTMQADGTECPLERLSEGTRDQVFLALRLAAMAAREAPLPFLADDLLVHFDEARTRAALRTLGDPATPFQTVLLTHHQHVADMARLLPGARVYVLTGESEATKAA